MTIVHKLTAKQHKPIYVHGVHFPSRVDNRVGNNRHSVYACGKSAIFDRCTRPPHADYTSKGENVELGLGGTVIAYLPAGSTVLGKLKWHAHMTVASNHPHTAALI